MTTVINTPGNNTSGDKGSGYGFLLGIILVVVIAILFFRYGLPAIRNTGTNDTKTTNINVQLPAVKDPITAPSTSTNTQPAQ